MVDIKPRLICKGLKNLTDDNFIKIETVKYACPNPDCDSVFTDKSNRNRHYNYHCGKPPRFQCPYCSHKSHRKSDVQVHINSRHRFFRNYVIELYNPCKKRNYINKKTE
ncbi:hypothetical protein G9C98_007949 [Cotesia typhae]|uniref:C2H2-type domain-containing protein n=1 Tax=Cotesia typhae TaxID=2053667 RepID=A0A8J5QJZ5_9HYME|nr:hypothetical protein G9C98_007949 [Cotesia typhae]